MNDIPQIPDATSVTCLQKSENNFWIEWQQQKKVWRKLRLNNGLVGRGIHFLLFISSLYTRIQSSYFWFADPIHARVLTLNLVNLLKPRMALTSHPLLALLRLHQSLLIDALVADPNLLDAAIGTNAEVVAALTDLLAYGHPVRAVSIAELGRLLCVDEPATINSEQVDSFPPRGIHRLRLAKDTLERAMAELSIGFGESGGDVSKRVREDLSNIRKEIELFNGLVDKSKRRVQ